MTSLFKTLVYWLTTLFVFACASIEDSDFFQPLHSNQYLYDAYSGETDFILPSDFKFDSTLLNKLTLESFDGHNKATIQAVYLGDLNQISNRKIIVYLHDKHGNLDSNWTRIKLLANLGLEQYGILAIDYRGYGLSSGSPSEQGIYADADAALRWLESKQVIGDNVVFYGYGLGAAAAVELSAHPRSIVASKMILEAPFASIESMIQNDMLQSFPGTYLSSMVFNSADTIKAVTMPLLWLHGTDDKTYDLKTQGHLVFDSHPGALNQSKFFYQVPGATHKNLPEKFSNSFDGFLVALHVFLESN